MSYFIFWSNMMFRNDQNKHLFYYKTFYVLIEFFEIVFVEKYYDKHIFSFVLNPI